MDVFFDGLLTDPRLDHAEGIAVHPDGSVWCGGEQGQLYRIAGGQIEQVASTGGFCLGLAFDSQLNLYICDLAHAAVFRYDIRGGTLEEFATAADGRRIVGPNFVAVDASDRVYVSDNGVPNQPGPGIYRFEPSGAGELWHEGPFNFANGMALSADERTLYVVESWARRITAIGIDEAGNAVSRQTIADLPGMIPDGLAVDADGELYVACYEPSRILKLATESGEWSVLADDPDAHVLCHPTNIAFHGTDLLAANLGRWHLTRIPVGIKGLALPAHRSPRSRPDDLAHS
jgi:gluconolactonase